MSGTIPLMTWPRRSKYGAIRTEYNGKKYHSKREAAYAQELDLRVRAGELTSWDSQYRIPLRVNGELVCHYVVDFVEHEAQGTDTYTEIKGMETQTFKLKWKLFEVLYPDLKKKIVK